jgi:hypothetical protein
MAKHKRIYRANPHASFSDDEARWIGSVIEKFGGDFTKEQLVDEAKPPDSQGHKLFTWDNDIAGPAYRLVEAAKHLRMVVIEIVHDGNKQPVRACFPVFHEEREAGAKRSYMSYDRIMETPDLARQVIEKGAYELKSWQRRYAFYKSVFGPVLDAIEEVEGKIWPQQNPSTVSRKMAQRLKANLKPRKPKPVRKSK